MDQGLWNIVQNPPQAGFFVSADPSLRVRWPKNHRSELLNLIDLLECPMFLSTERVAKGSDP